MSFVRRGALAAAALAAALVSMPCAAQVSAVDKGVAWLSQQVQANGTVNGEDASMASASQARVESLTTLRQLASAPAPLADLVAQDGTATVEYLSRKARTLAPLGRDVSATVNLLLARQNADGGFGGAAGYQSNPLDTAHALLALRAASSGGTPVANAVAYLKSVQAANGSFSLLEPGSVFVTAHALEALAGYSATQSVASNVASARTWLLDQRQQGAYAGTLDNATALLALIASSTDPLPLAGPAGAIAAAQETNGSWKSDPYLTAVALRALAAARELLGPATTGEVSGIVAEQASGAPLAGVAIQLTGPQSASGTTDAQGVFAIGNLLPGSYTLQASKAGFASAAVTVAIVAGVTSRVGTIRVEVSTTTATVQGTVLDGVTGQGLAGATVQIAPGGSAVTDASGNYRIANLLPGTVTFTASMSGYESVTVTAAISANVVYTFSPSLYPPGQGPNGVSVRGKVVDRATNAAIAGAVAKVGTISTTTSATGEFLLQGLTAGTVSLEVSAAGYRTSTLSGSLAAGTNDIGTVPLDRVATTLTVSGRVSDAQTNLPVGGATVAVQGTSLVAVTNSNGNYTLPGVDVASFTLSFAAAGYQARQVPVALQSIADVVVDAALTKSATGSIVLRQVATGLPSYPPYSGIEIEATLENTSGVPADVQVVAYAQDPATGARLFQVGPAPASIPGNGTREVELEGHNGAAPAGTYNVLVQVLDGVGSLIAEGSASFVIMAKAQLAGDVTLDPPIVQSGTGQSVRMTAAVTNFGNVALAAGQGELTVTLVNPDPTVGIAPSVELLPGVLAGGVINGPAGGGFDAQGNFYFVNKSDRKVIKITADGTTATTVVTLPATLPATSTLPARGFVPTDSLVDPSGTVHILNQQFEIVSVAPDGSYSRRLTNLSSGFVQDYFDRDPAGNFHMVVRTLSGAYSLVTVPTSGPNIVYPTSGLPNPRGIALGSDGNLYVTNTAGSTVSRVRTDGSIEPFVLTGLSSPQGIAAHPDGSLFVANNGANNIVRFRVDNNAVSVHASVQSPTDVALDAAGNLWVASGLAQEGVLRIPAGSTVPETMARSLVQSPQGMRYDAAGTLYVVGANAVKMTAAEIITQLNSGTLCNGADIALGPSGKVFLTSACFNQIIRVSGDVRKVWGTASINPYGMAYDGANLLYVTEASGSPGANRIVTYDANAEDNPQRLTVAESLLLAPKAVRLDGAGNRYILNTDSITRLPADGSKGAFVVAAGTFSSGVALALTADGYLVQENNAVRRLGGTAWTRTGLNALANGVAEGAGGEALVGDTVQRKILRVTSSGVSDLSLVPFAVGKAPTALTTDGASGVYVALASGELVRVDAGGVATTLTTAAISPAPTRLAYDPVGNRLYFVNGAGIRSFSLASRTVDPVVLAPDKTFESIEAAAGQVFATRLAQRELFSVNMGSGVATALAAGFLLPQPIVWNGTQLIFSDANNTFALVPGGNPVIVAYETFTHLAWQGGVLYGTRRDRRVYSFQPGVDAAPKVHLTVPDTRGQLQGIAFRADGVLTVGSDFDGSVWSYAPGNPNPIATYAGLSSVQNIAVAPSGDVYVNSSGSSKLVLIPAGSRQARQFAADLSMGGLAFSGSDLYATNGNDVVRFASNGTFEKLPPTIVGSLKGLVVQGGTVYVADSAGIVHRLAAGVAAPFAVGLNNPKRVRAHPSGGMLVASSGNGIVSRMVDGKLSVYAKGFITPTSLAFAANGDLLVGGDRADLFALSAAGTVTRIGNISQLYGFSGTNASASSFPLDSLTVDAAGTVWSVSQTRNQVDRIVYHPAGGGPAAGTVIGTPTLLNLPAMAVGDSAPAIDLGAFAPPYAGDYRFRLRPVGSQVEGDAVGALHVGPHAAATLAANKSKVQPGSPTVGITATVSGADFTSAARADPRSISTVVSNVAMTSAFGMDSAGALYMITNGRMRRYTSARGFVDYASSPQGTFSIRGALPVDGDGNVYVVGGTTSTNIYQVKPAADGISGVATAITDTPLSETIWSLARSSAGVIYALGTTKIFRLDPPAAAGQPWTPSVLPTGALSANTYLTIDAKDNLYYLGGGAIIVFRPDGSRTILAEVTVETPGYYDFEHAGGAPIAGDCADNLFVTPYNWKDIKPGQEENVLLHLNGRTGRPSAVVEGSKTRPSLGDMDGMVFDRFSGSMLLQVDLIGGESSVAFYRMPVTCGAIDTDLHMVFPATHSVAGFSVAPKGIYPRADGSREYVWSFKDVTNAGKSLGFNATLSGVQYGETRGVATEAFLSFKNPFVAGNDLRVPVEVPEVLADSMVDLALAASPEQVQANSAVAGEITLVNRDSASPITGTLTVEVTDSQGSRVALLSQAPETLAASSSRLVTATFDTATHFSGAYMIKATLTGAGGVELARGTAGFYIASPAEVLLPSVATDRQFYDANATVNVFGRVRNVSLNTIATGHRIYVKVRNPAGQVILDSSDPIDLLVPQATKGSTFTLRLQGAAPGNYEVEAILRKGDAQVGTTQYADFNVLSTASTGTGLGGGLLAPRIVNVGEGAGITANVRNDGNGTVSQLTVRIQVVNPATSAVIATFEEPGITLAPQASVEIRKTWTATPAGDYAAVGTAILGTQSISLGQDAIRVVADTTPDAFAFTPVTNAPTSTLIASDTITISGISVAVPVSISGGQYSIDGGPWTAVAGTVTSGARIQVRVLSAATGGTPASATLTVSGVSAAFTVTTTTEDRTPDPFAFVPVTGALPGSVNLSNEVSITGINVPVPVSISGGAYSINGGAFGTADGQVVAGDRVVLRVVAPAFGATTGATLTVSGVSATFNVTSAIEDGTPDAFAFVPQINVAVGTVATSNEVVVTGINTSVPVGIAGGSFSVNGGAFTAASGLVGNGARIVVRQTASTAFNTKTTAILTVGGVSAGFDVTTEAEDRTPDAFAFTPQINVPLQAVRTSNLVTISGINTRVPVTITGGEYSLNGVAYTTAAGEVKAGDTIVVRQTSSSAFSTKTTATLTVSTLAVPFDVTTEAEDRTPDAFAFTPQVNVKVDTVATSNEVLVTGINTTVPITIAGGAGARDIAYSVNGGAFVAAPGTVKDGDRVRVRQTSSASFSTKTTATLTVSTLAVPFDVTTEAEDRTPEAFTFLSQANVPLQAVRTSNAVTITDINTTVPVTIAGGEYSVNGGAFTAAAGQVKAGDVLMVRQTSSSAFATKTTATLTVSTVSAAFDVTTVSVAQVTLALGFNTDSRVLALVSCKSSQGASDPVCEAERRTYVDNLLTALGIEHLVTIDTTAFEVAMRGGRYNTYWVSGGAEKLQGTLAEEVREAAFRGDSLIVDGVHDDRNQLIDEVLGITYGGRVSGVTTVVLTGPFLPSGTFTFAGEPIKADLIDGGTRQAGFDAAAGPPAIVTNNYGAGRGVLFAFDLVATMIAQPASTLLRSTLVQSVEYSRPASTSAITGGALAPFAMTFTNAEPVAVTIEVVATLPGFTFARSDPATAAPGETRWNLTVPAAGSLTLEWSYIAPTTAGSYTGTVTVTQTYGSTRVALGSAPLAVTVSTIETVLPGAISQLQALALTVTAEQQARDRAVLSLQQAQTAIGQGQHETAIGLLIDAVNQLDPVTSTSTAVQHAAIDKVMQEVSRRWYLALPLCPATPVCR